MKSVQQEAISAVGILSSSGYCLREPTFNSELRDQLDAMYRDTHVDDARAHEITLCRICDGRTLSQIAKEYKISRSRVDVIVQTHLRRLRHPHRVVYFGLYWDGRDDSLIMRTPTREGE